MRPLWVISHCPYRVFDLVPRLALQLEKCGYLVRIAEESKRSSHTVYSLVVIAVRPRWGWWLESVRWASTQCWLIGHKWVLKKVFEKGQEKRRYLWRCQRCRASHITRTLKQGGEFHGGL